MEIPAGLQIAGMLQRNLHQGSISVERTMRECVHDRRHGSGLPEVCGAV
ncbi:hypothetical protein [Noviherbaspirillum saxi]|nr:hypothetical protein [Noviherbaspirillum saxi]